MTTEKIRRLYVAWSVCGEDRRAKEFDRWLAAHDLALREQIADDIITKWCTCDGYQPIPNEDQTDE